jgi:glutathione synthase/RimK-type ligase-like ATP-grasp enzyme
LKKKCALLTMKDLSKFECYDNLIVNPLEEMGWICDQVPWDTNKLIDWDQYDSVIIRSTWNYQENFLKFINVLKEINSSSADLQNPIDIVEWNLNKQYLKDFENKNIKIVPSQWFNNFIPKEIIQSFLNFNSKKIIIKPCISANADYTYILEEKTALSKLNTLKKDFIDKEFIIQPFIQDIKNEGEYSLIYFGNTLSHVLLKTPKVGDFRVQEEHGGTLKSIINPEQALIRFGKNVINKLPRACLYSRVDIVRNKNEFLLMEVELIEPSLYFNMDSKSPKKFVEVFNKWDA